MGFAWFLVFSLIRAWSFKTVDVIHVVKNISNIKRDDTHCLTEDPLIEMFV